MTDGTVWRRVRNCLLAGFFLSACSYARAAAAPAPGFTIAGPTGQTTVQNPGAASVTITVTPVNGFTGGVNFNSCNMVAGPDGAINPPVCGIFGPVRKPPTVTISNASPVAFSLTVATARVPLPTASQASAGLAVGAVGLASLLLIGFSGWRRKYGSFLVLLLALASAGMVSLAVGCGASFSNRTTPGRYSFTATASDMATGKITASTSFTVLVQ
jgi:hypothetical protein